jgi:hypothetical protein
MAIVGWQRRDMLDRYTRATAAERAAQEAGRLTSASNGCMNATGMVASMHPVYSIG